MRREAGGRRCLRREAGGCGRRREARGGAGHRSQCRLGQPGGPVPGDHKRPLLHGHPAPLPAAGCWRRCSRAAAACRLGSHPGRRLCAPSCPAWRRAASSTSPAGSSRSAPCPPPAAATTARPRLGRQPRHAPCKAGEEEWEPGQDDRSSCTDDSSEDEYRRQRGTKRAVAGQGAAAQRKPKAPRTMGGQPADSDGEEEIPEKFDLPPRFLCTVAMNDLVERPRMNLLCTKVRWGP